MPETPINKLLEQKPIYIICDKEEYAVFLFKYLSWCNDIGWASKKIITPLDTRWEAEKQNMVYNLTLRKNLTRLTRMALDHLPPIVMTFSNQDDPDVLAGHVFTVQAFISYLRSQGATNTCDYNLYLQDHD